MIGFDAASCELEVIGTGQPYHIPSLLNGTSAGHWVDVEACWAVAHGRQPSVTCERSWESLGGTRRDFVVVCPLAAAVIGCHVDGQSWIQPQLSV